MAAVYSSCLLLWHKISTVHPTIIIITITFFGMAAVYSPCLPLWFFFILNLYYFGMAAVYSPCLLIWYKISTVHPTLAFTIYDIQNLYYIQNLKSASYSGIYYRTPLYTYIYIYINSIDSINIVYIHTKCYRGVDIHYVVNVEV